MIPGGLHSYNDEIDRADRIRCVVTLGLNVKIAFDALDFEAFLGDVFIIAS